MTDELDRARAFIAKARWVFAKSVPQHPHEYCLRRWLEPALQADFDAFAALIAERGYRGPYWGATWTYLDVDAHKYWISRELHGGDGLIVNPRPPGRRAADPGGEPAMKAVIYAAKSTEDKHGSIPTQLEDARTLAERDGLEVIAEFYDEAKSAYKANRGSGLAQSMAHAEREGCALIVQHSDRLARGDGDRAQHLVEIVLWARKAGVTLKSVQDPQTFDGMGLVYAALMGDRNHEDSARKSAAVRAGHKRRVAKGLPMGAVPIGYVAETAVVDGVAVTRRVIDRDGSLPLVERIFALAVTGHTPGDISRTLNAEGIVTRRGSPWSNRAVRWVIENRDYLGENGYEALIDQATWERAQRPKRRYVRADPRLPADEFVLGGIAVCFDCGAAMRSRRAANGRRTYRCANAMEGRNSCTTSRPVPAEDAERELIANAVGYLPTLDDWLLEQVGEHRAEQAHTERALTAARKALQGTERRLERLLDDYERLPEAEARLVLRRATSVEAERDEVERRVRDLEAVVSEHELDDPDLEAAHDLYLRLAAFAVGRLDEASSSAEVRAALSSLISQVRLGFEDGELVVAASLRVVESQPLTLVYDRVSITGLGLPPLVVALVPSVPATE